MKATNIGILNCKSCKKDILEYDIDTMIAKQSEDEIKAKDFRYIDHPGPFSGSIMLCPNCSRGYINDLRNIWRELHKEWDEEENN